MAYGTDSHCITYNHAGHHTPQTLVTTLLSLLLVSAQGVGVKICGTVSFLTLLLITQRSIQIWGEPVAHFILSGKTSSHFFLASASRSGIKIGIAKTAVRALVRSSFPGENVLRKGILPNTHGRLTSASEELMATAFVGTSISSMDIAEFTSWLARNGSARGGGGKLGITVCDHSAAICMSAIGSLVGRPIMRRQQLLVLLEELRGDLLISKRCRSAQWLP
jgi:hypothetical protein